MAAICSSLLYVTTAFSIEKKSWTFLVYIAGDNNLAKYADLDLKEMMQVGSNDTINILAYTTIKREGEDKRTVKYYIEKDNLLQIGELPAKDSGDVATLTEALEWAHVEYPADHFALVLWDHGSGILNRSSCWLKGICMDDTTGHYLTDRNLFAACGYICDTYRNGKKIDVIACDACLMGSVEMAYTLQPYADYYVASEETIPGYGFPYDQVLAPFIEGSLEPIDFATNLVKVYAESYDATKTEYTISAIDLHKVEPLVKQLDLVAQFFTNQLKMRNPASVKKELLDAIKKGNCIHFAVEQYVDLYQSLQSILAHVPNMTIDYSKRWYISKVIKDTLPLIDSCVIANKCSALYKDMQGLSVYFTLDFVDASYGELLWADWTKWPDFMRALVAA